MEDTGVTTEPTDEMLTSEIEFVEHPIKLDPEELACFQSEMEATEVTTEPTDEMMTSKIEIEEHPIKLEPEKLDCLQSDSTQSSNNPTNLQKCEQCDIVYEPKLFTFHTKICHGSDAVVNIMKLGIQHTYQCVLCKSVYKTFPAAIDHLHLNHQLPNFPHHCKYCNKSINLWKSLIKHQKICSVKKNIPLKLNCVKCVQYDIKYANPEMLAWHIENCHGENPIVRIERIGGNKISFHCVYCQDSFKQFYVIIEHLNSKHQLSNLPYRCNICNKQFVRKCNMRRHKLGCKKNTCNSEAQSILQIEKAEEILTSELDIEGHQIRLATEEIQLNTQNADSTSSTIMKEDRNVKHLKCDICGMRYVYPEVLDWHSKYCHGTDAIVKIVRNNNNNASYECTFCNTVLCVLEKMAIHLRCKHQFNDMPYYCNDCGRNFIRRGTFVYHRMIANCVLKQPGVDDQASETSCREITNPMELIANCVLKQPGVDDQASETSFREITNPMELIANCVLKQPGVDDQAAETSCREITNPMELGPVHVHLSDMDHALKNKILGCRVIVPKLLECELCRFYTNSKFELNIHIQAHLKPNASAGNRLKIQPGSKRKKFKNQQSVLKFYLPDMLVWHNKFCHGTDAIVTVLKINDKLYTYRCEICNRSFKNIDLVIFHLKQDHRLKKLPFRCKVCNKIFTLNFNLMHESTSCIIGRNI